MRFCVSCGHELGVGRFCTNCGHPIDRAAVDDDWRTGTAERPAVPAPPSTPPPSTPPPTAPPSLPPPPLTPPPPRFPLYADEAAEVDDVARAAAGSEPPTATFPVPEPATHRESRRPWGLWALVVLALVAVAGLGVWLVGDGDPGRPADRRGASAATSGPTTGDGSAGATGTGDPDAPAGVMDGATVEVPRTAPPGQDVSGNPVDYEGDNLLDGVPETTWRMPGDGTGEEIVITLARESRLQQVGLINGYAKVARDAQGRQLDWYHGNRRVTAVEWVFDDGTTISQDLEDTTAVQSVDVDTTTTTITLRLVEVSAPGTGRAARDYTAISDVSLVGRG